MRFETNLMKAFFLQFLLLFFAISLLGCKKNNENLPSEKTVVTENLIHYAKGFSIHNYQGFSIVKVINPWPKANKKYTVYLFLT